MVSIASVKTDVIYLVVHLVAATMLLPAAVQAEPLFKVVGTDVSKRYEHQMDETEPSEETKAKLQSLRVLFVPGFLSDVVLELGDMPGMKALRIGEYFDEQIRWLKDKQGVKHVERVMIESEDSIQNNAERVAASILASEQDVLLITHSKGGLDSLEALIQYPSLRPKVKGWIALQSPWYGSPVADWVSDNKALDKVTREFLERIMKGQGESLGNLTTTQRAAYHKRFQDEIQKIVMSIPIISVATYKTGIMGGPVACTAFEPLRISMKKKLNLESDGVVPWESAVLEGTDYVVIPDASHLDTVRPLPCNMRFSREEMTGALLSLLAAKMSP
jgi:hypothetical protein